MILDQTLAQKAADVAFSYFVISTQLDFHLHMEEIGVAFYITES